MVNIDCSQENTSLSNVKNSTFERCNIRNCILDESNTLIKSIYVPEKPEEIEEESVEELKARVTQLETFIESKSLKVPAKTVEVDK